MEYFKPKRPDGKSMREVMVEGLKDCDYGTIVNYKALGDILTISDKQKIQATVRVANRDLLKFYQRGLRNIPGVGYRISYRMPEQQAPWPDAMVEGHANDEANACRLISIAMQASGGWAD